MIFKVNFDIYNGFSRKRNHGHVYSRDVFGYRYDQPLLVNAFRGASSNDGVPPAPETEETLPM